MNISVSFVTNVEINKFREKKIEFNVKYLVFWTEMDKIWITCSIKCNAIKKNSWINCLKLQYKRIINIACN